MSQLEATVIAKCSAETKAKLQAMAHEVSLPLSVYLRLLYEQHLKTPLKIELVKKVKL